MLYGDFQRRRGVWREREMAERSADITSPRPPLNASITDQALRELLDRVAALEAAKQPVSGVDHLEKLGSTAERVELADAFRIGKLTK